MLLDAVLNVGSEVELASTLQHVVDSAADLTEARYGALALAGPAHGRGRSRIAELFSVGLSEDERRRITRLPTGHTGLLGHPGSTLSLGVPVRVNNDVLGYLCLARKRHGPFTEEDLALLRVLASQAGIAIGNARLYGTARQRERWIEGAAAVTTALLTGESAEDALTTLAKAARILAGAAAGVVLQPTDEGGMEIVAASALDDPGDIVGTSIAPGSPVLVQLLGGEPVYIDDSSTDPRMTTHVRSRFGPSMMLPLQSGGRLIGTLALPRKRGGRPYTPVDRMLATQFASQAALALVLADAQHNRERLAVFEDRDRIARDLHDLVVQRLFATEMMLESTRRRTGEGSWPICSATPWTSWTPRSRRCGPRSSLSSSRPPTPRRACAARCCARRRARPSSSGSSRPCTSPGRWTPSYGMNCTPGCWPRCAVRWPPRTGGPG